MSLASAAALLQTALALLAVVNANPSLPQSTRDNAQQMAQQAIAQATTAIQQSKPTSGSGTVADVATPPSHPSASASGSGVTSQYPHGVDKQDIVIGRGETALPGSNVSVTYVGKLQDGSVFDSSAMHDNQPLTFVLGAKGTMPPGFQIGVVGMKVGGERLITVPPPLAYGNQNVKDSTGRVVIPPNSPLVFDIRLVQVQAYYTPSYFYMTGSSTASTTVANQGAGAFTSVTGGATAAQNTPKYWYPPSCTAWYSLSNQNIEAFPTLEALLAKYPGRVESPGCE